MSANEALIVFFMIELALIYVLIIGKVKRKKSPILLILQMFQIII